MTSPRAASLAKPIAYAPDTAFSLNLTFPESYDLSTKWIRFEARKGSSSTIVFSVDEDSAAVSYSGQVVSIHILPATVNDVTDGDDWGDIIDTVAEMLWNVDVGADADTATTEYRVQGDLQVLPEHGQFEDDSNVTSLTLSFESQTVAVTFGGPGPAGEAGAAGQGLPAGGTVGQVATKASGDDYDVEWTNAGAGDMIAANNLSDLADAGTARTNLGLGTAATSATGDFAAAAHSHTLSDISDAGTAAASNTGDFEASGAVSTHASVTSGVHGISAFGATLVDDADAATARTTLGLGTAATSATGDFAAAAHSHTLSDISDAGTAAASNTGDFEAAGAVSTHASVTSGVHGISAFGATLVDDADAATARTTLGLGTAATSATGDFAAAAHSHTLSDISDAGTAAASNAGDFEASGAVSTHASVTSGVHGISAFGATLVDDADAAAARTTLGVDAAGTDNSTPVTLAGSLDYLTISGQQITRNAIDLTTDITGTLPATNGGTGVTALTSLNLSSLGSGAATDGYVATADGAGGVAWEAAAGGGGGNWTDLSTNGVELEDGTTACYVDIYNTDDGAGNSEYARLGWDANEFVISTLASGAESNIRNVKIVADGTTQAALFGDGYNIIGPCTSSAYRNNVALTVNGPVSLTGFQQILIGKSTSAAISGTNAIGIGNAPKINASNSVGIGGQYALTTRENQLSGPRISGAKSNYGSLHLGGQTTSGSATVIGTIAVPTDQCFGFWGIVTGLKTDQTKSGSWIISGQGTNDSGTLTMYGTAVSDNGDNHSAAWSVSIAANGANIEISATAEATADFSVYLQFAEQKSAAYYA